MKKMLLILLCLILSFGMFAENIEEKIEVLENILVKEPKNISALLELGKLYHSLAADGHKDAVPKAEKIFEEVLKIEPDNAEALVWYGSVLTLKGYYEWLPIMKLVYVWRGIEEMRKAVELDPDNPVVRLVRANTSLALPRFFMQLKVAVRDFEYLLMLYEKSPNKFSKDMLVNIYLGLEKAYKKIGDEEEAKKCKSKAEELLHNPANR